MLPVTSYLPLGSTPTPSSTKCFTINVPLSPLRFTHVSGMICCYKWTFYFTHNYPYYHTCQQVLTKCFTCFLYCFSLVVIYPSGTHSQLLRIQARPLQISRILNWHNLQHDMMTGSYDTLKNTHSYLLQVCCYPLK